MRMKSFFIYLTLLGFCMMAKAQPTNSFPLWPEGAPGALGSEPKDIPTLTPFFPSPDKATGAAFVICPGGAYVGLADHEGSVYAKWLADHGIAGFVLKYRLGGRAGYHHPAMMQDGMRAMRLVRAKAAEWKIDPHRIGIMGSSAGGHLASTIGTHFDSGKAQAADPIDRVSCRPDFMVLAYPVISFVTPYVHKGSMRALLGENPDPKLQRLLSNELQVASDTPPTFLFSTNDDTGVPCENSVLFFLALRKSHVPAEMHIFEPGPHGVGLAPTHAALSIWPTLLANWFRTRGLLK